MTVVGRERELATIRARMQAAEDGSAQQLCVTGEGGIGKSVILGTILDEVTECGWTVIAGHADALERSIPFATLARMIASIAPSDGYTAALLDELRQAFDAAGAGGRAEIEASFGRTCGLVTKVLGSLLERRPLVIAIDDIDQLDDDSLALAGIAARRLAAGRLALLATSRSVPPAGPPTLWAMTKRIAEALPGTTRLDLAPLDENATAALLAEVLGAEPDRTLSGEVHRRADGIPFFVEAIAGSVRAGGLIAIEGDRAWLTGEIRLTRARALVERLVPLEPDTRTVLEAISVAGQASTAQVGWLAAVTDLDEIAVARALDDLALAKVLIVSGDGYRFRHELVREAAYASIGGARRQLLHAQIAERLRAERAAGAAVDLPTLARHISAGAQPGDSEAAAVLAEAGDAARDMAPRSAAELYGRAAQISAPDDPIRAVALARRCRALSLAGLPADAVTAGMEALAALPAGRERRSTTNAMIHSLVEMRRLDEALAVVDDEIARGTASPVTIADRARVLWMLQRFDEGLAEAHRAVAAPAASDSERLLALGPLGIVSACTGRPLPLREMTDEMLRLGARLPPALELYATSVSAYALATAGHIGAAVAPLGRAEMLLDEVGGGVAFRSWTMLARVFVDWLQGRWDDTAEQSAGARGEFEGAHYELQLEALDAIAIEVHTRRGQRVPDSLLTQRSGTTNFADLKAWAIAGARVATGDYDSARGVLAHAMSHSQIGVAYRPLLLARGVEVERAAGDAAAAAAALDRLETEARGGTNPWGEVLMLRCRAAVRRDADSARAAMTAAERGGHAFEGHLAALTLAELDADAGELLTRTYRAFQALDADPLRRHAGRLLRDRGLKVPRARRNGAGPLSDNELKIARLVQEGLRNKEIASALHYSPRTVEHTISRIFAKLEVSSRVQLARALDSRALAPGPEVSEQ